MVIAALLSVGITTQNTHTQENHSEFIEAFNAEDTPLMLKVLKNYNRETINKKSNYGETLLMIAVFIGNADIVRAAIEAGAEIDAQDCDGYTALMEAASLGDVEIIKALLAAGAQIDMQDGDGYTALMEAAEQGKSEAVRALVDAGANMEINTNDYYTALMLADLSGHTEIVAILRNAGAQTYQERA